MALVECPKCKQQISDKARRCPVCGYESVAETNAFKCEECGTLLNQSDGVCPKCGCPVDENENDTKEQMEVQQVEVAGIKVKKKTKVYAAIVIILLLCAGGAIIGYKKYSDYKAEQEYQQAYNAYIDNLEAVRLLMLLGGSDAEGLCNLTAKVWYNTIYEEKDTETDKYTMFNKVVFNSDFNTSIANLYSDSETQSTLSDIESNQSAVKVYIKDLQNPPEGLEKCYDTVSGLYDVYKTLTDLAINPSGNLSSFSSNKNNAISDFMSEYEKLDNLIPDKFEVNE